MLLICGDNMGYFVEYYDGSTYETIKGIVGICMSIVLLYWAKNMVSRDE